MNIGNVDSMNFLLDDKWNNFSCKKNQTLNTFLRVPFGAGCRMGAKRQKSLKKEKDTLVGLP